MANSRDKSSLSPLPLAGQRVLMFTGEVYEDLELWYPKLRLIEAGATVVVAGEQAATEYAGKHGYPSRSDIAIDSVETREFQALVVPGGFMPDRLRRLPRVLEIVREFFTDGKPVAAICHGGWIPISAGIYRGVRVTGSPGIKDDLINAGAIYEDSSVVVDRNSVSSRRPEDLPDFCRSLIELMVG
ncbi:MAG: type 1 glutamine amidotransferase [Pirellulaceae bacterium]|nr:type 1 glutamine amidotransferase [Pirellulaceae bacterium]